VTEGVNLYPLPLQASPSLGRSPAADVRAAGSCALTFAGLSPPRADRVAVRALEAVARRALGSLTAASPPGGLPPHEHAAVRELARGLARRAVAAALRSPGGGTAAELRGTEKLCRDLAKAAADRAARAPLIEDGVPARWPAVGGERAFPFAGCLRTDGLDLAGLAGAAGRPPILRPVELTAAGGPVRDLHGAVRVLRNAVHACTLLANQADQVRCGTGGDSRCSIAQNRAWRFRLRTARAKWSVATQISVVVVGLLRLS
jgi:hypothetical protein